MGSWSGTQIAIRVRRQFGDVDSAQVTDADLVDWINAACRDIVAGNNLLQVQATAAVTANTPSYDVPTNLIKLRRIAFQGASLRGMSVEEADELIPTHDATVSSGGYPTGTPNAYWIFAGKINLYPAPSANGASDLIIYYNRSPAIITTLDSTPELPSQYDNRIVEYCLAQAFELDTNFQLSQIKTSQFQQGIDRLKGDSVDEIQETYPYITVTSEAGY